MIIKTKLVGVTFNSRQQNLRLVQKSFRLFWKHDILNKYDPNAILVFADPSQKKELGHLNRKLAQDFVLRMADGKEQSIYCEQVTGGKGGKSFGMNVKIIVQ